MSGLIVPQVVYGLSNEELAELVAKALKEIDWAFNGNISDQNISRIANFIASRTEFKHISGLVGMSGFDPANPLATRFWSGDADKSLAPWRVNQGGQMFAMDAFITGLITGSTIIGGVIKTSESGARIELEGGVLKGYSASGNLHGLVFNPTPVSNFFDLFFYHDGVKYAELFDDGIFFKLRPTISSGLGIGGPAGPIRAIGEWLFSGNATFDLDISGKISQAYYADNAGVAAAADSLAPSGNIAWGQVLKSGSNVADLATKNLSSMTDDSTHRTVTDTEKSTWNAKAPAVSPSFTGNIDASAATFTQSEAAAHQSTGQTIGTTNAYVKLLFQTEDYDTLGEYDPTTSTFTAAKAGNYTFAVSMQVALTTAPTRILISIFVNGSEKYRLFDNSFASTGTSPCATGSGNVKLAAGDTVTFQLFNVANAMGTTATASTSYFTIKRQ